MIFRIVSVVTLSLALSGCSNGVSLNPLDWFGPKSDVENVTLEPKDGWPGDALDYRGPIQQVTKLYVERSSGGVIVRAVGVPATLGYWEAELVPDDNEQPVNGVMSYTFKVAPPAWQMRQSTPAAREITVAHFVSDTKLSGATSIRVVGASNSLSARR